MGSAVRSIRVYVGCGDGDHRSGRGGLGARLMPNASSSSARVTERVPIAARIAWRSHGSSVPRAEIHPAALRFSRSIARNCCRLGLREELLFAAMPASSLLHSESSVPVYAARDWEDATVS